MCRSNMNSSGSGEIINVECDVSTSVKEKTSGKAKFSAGLRRIPFNEVCFIFLFPLSDYYLISYVLVCFCYAHSFHYLGSYSHIMGNSYIFKIILFRCLTTQLVDFGGLYYFQSLLQYFGGVNNMEFLELDIRLD